MLTSLKQHRAVIQQGLSLLLAATPPLMLAGSALRLLFRGCFSPTGPRCISLLALKYSCWDLPVLFPHPPDRSRPTSPVEQAKFASRVKSSSWWAQGIHAHELEVPTPLFGWDIGLATRTEAPAGPVGLFSHCAGRERAAGAGCTCRHRSLPACLLWDACWDLFKHAPVEDAVRRACERRAGFPAPAWQKALPAAGARGVPEKKGLRPGDALN